MYQWHKIFSIYGITKGLVNVETHTLYEGKYNFFEKHHQQIFDLIVVVVCVGGGGGREGVQGALMWPQVVPHSLNVFSRKYFY